MSPKWTDSTDKHGVDRADATYAILHADFTAVVEERERSEVRLFIGPRHAQALPHDEIEVLVEDRRSTGQEAVIFHVMPLGDKFRQFREDHK